MSAHPAKIVAPAIAQPETLRLLQGNPTMIEVPGHLLPDLLDELERRGRRAHSITTVKSGWLVRLYQGSAKETR